ncbi:MAG: outer membrane protein assembly factor [Candidatus Kapaibacterium sp.]
MRAAVLLIISFIPFALTANAQQAPNVVADELYTSFLTERRHEIGKIEFKGNSTFKEEMLFQYISAEASERSMVHKLVQGYYKNFLINSFKPDELMDAFDEALQSMSHQISYWDENIAETDLQTLVNFYNLHGFHEVEVYYTFLPDTNLKENVLTFHIKENDRYTLEDLVYKGLDDVAPEVLSKINNIKLAGVGDYFNENKVVKEVNSIHSTLLNNGYYYASYEVPTVSVLKPLKADSITVSFSPGKRLRIGSLNFVDSLQGQNKIVTELKKKLIEISPGQWYSRKMERESEDNLYNLGLFDLVDIDTTAGQPQDSTLDLTVETHYRKQKQWGIGLFLNRTQFDDFLNTGVELSFTHKNAFGAAQSVNLFTNAKIRDISRTISQGGKIDYEFTIGSRWSQPIVWELDNSKWGFSFNPSYSYRQAENFLKLRTYSIPIKFPAQLPSVTYFNRMTVDFTFEREEPINFSEDISRQLERADTQIDSNRVREALLIYGNLDNYLQSREQHILTANLAGITIIGDNRRNPLDPQDGTYSVFSVDGWNIFLAHPLISGVSKYIRLQGAHHQYIPVSGNTIGAFKIRMGGIVLFDDESSYVPFERQFFAGGANSVRGWGSRELRYFEADIDSIATDPGLYNFLQDFVGNSAIIEGSVEIRHRFNRPRGFSEFVADQIANLGLTLFFDFGNSYNWFANDPAEINIGDYFSKLALAGGFGLRYYLAFGPISIDFGWPLYDPMGLKEARLEDIQLHFGLGHSF